MGVSIVARLEAQMNSVERVMFYSEHIEPGAASRVLGDDDLAGETWPSAGEIVIKDATLKYRDGPDVLKGISFSVKGGEKLGIVGRTGSGKSSLIAALFRIVELSEGSITIDGVDISKVGTSALRKKLSIIPQDPILFSNTVKYNLDPFGVCNDDEIWDVLKKVTLENIVRALPNGLLELVAEGGENFSLGQRQLICIARCLLRRPRILILDEATASIDNETDNAIQMMIRENFKDATVLTIAHRLNTVLDSDRILVLDGGRIVELASPKHLLEKKDGVFRGMTDKSQEAEK